MTLFPFYCNHTYCFCHCCLPHIIPTITVGRWCRYSSTFRKALVDHQYKYCSGPEKQKTKARDKMTQIDSPPYHHKSRVKAVIKNRQRAKPQTETVTPHNIAETFYCRHSHFPLGNQSNLSRCNTVNDLGSVPSRSSTSSVRWEQLQFWPQLAY